MSEARAFLAGLALAGAASSGVALAVGVVEYKPFRAIVDIERCDGQIDTRVMASDADAREVLGETRVDIPVMFDCAAVQALIQSATAKVDDNDQAVRAAVDAIGTLKAIDKAEASYQ